MRMGSRLQGKSRHYDWSARIDPAGCRHPDVFDEGTVSGDCTTGYFAWLDHVAYGADDSKQATSVRTKLVFALSHLNAIKNNQEAHVYSLPSEILSHIFIAGMPTFESQAADDRETVIQRRGPILQFGQQAGWNPLHLSAVSRYWRSVAVSLPVLWTMLPFRSTPDGSPERFRTRAVEWGIALARLFLARSSDKPLDVIIWKQHPNVYERIREVFVGNETRVRSLFLGEIIRDNHNRCLPLDNWSVSLPVLKSLWLVKAQSTTPIGLDLELPQPLLSRLELVGIGQWTGKGVPNLTTLVLISSGSDMGYFRFLNFLASVPHLDKIEILHGFFSPLHLEKNESSNITQTVVILSLSVSFSIGKNRGGFLKR